MTSQDINANNNYVTVDLLNAHMARLEAIMEKNLALTRADIAELKSEMKQEIAKVEKKLTAEVIAVERQVEIQNARISSLYHVHNWTLAIIAIIIIVCCPKKKQN